MLIYNPALDPYHCAIRFLAIATLCDQDLPFETAQIIDFSFLFPEILVLSRLPQSIADLRKLARNEVSPYRPTPKGNSAIRTIRAIQVSAGSTLAAKSLIDQRKFQTGFLSISTAALPEELSGACESFLEGNRAFYSKVATSLVTVPHNGRDGLKHRTGLMEHRYDAV